MLIFYVLYIYAFFLQSKPPYLAQGYIEKHYISFLPVTYS